MAEGRRYLEEMGEWLRLLLNDGQKAEAWADLLWSARQIKDEDERKWMIARIQRESRSARIYAKDPGDREAARVLEALVAEVDQLTRRAPGLRGIETTIR